MALLLSFFLSREGAQLLILFGVAILRVGVEALNVESTGSSVSRRDLFFDVAAVASGVGGLLLPSQAAFGDSDASQPIAILGASGRTGALCITACLRRGLPCRALTRSGSWAPPVGNEDEISSILNNNLLTVAACDVKDPKALANSLKGCRGVVYAASASKQGGNAKEIDNDGVVTAGNVCLAQNIARYIVISSTAVTRPHSMGYKFTNIFGGIMEQKRFGEEGIQFAYKSARGTSSYSILRPGGLEEPKKNEILGPKSLEISQGDALAGIVSRSDLAEVAVELAVSNAENLRNTALELYYADSTQPCERQFKPMMTNGVVPRLNGFSTYAGLLEGVQPDIDYYVPS